MCLCVAVFTRRQVVGDETTYYTRLATAVVAMMAFLSCAVTALRFAYCSSSTALLARFDELRSDALSATADVGNPTTDPTDQTTGLRGNCGYTTSQELQCALAQTEKRSVIDDAVSSSRGAVMLLTVFSSVTCIWNIAETSDLQMAWLGSVLFVSFLVGDWLLSASKLPKDKPIQGAASHKPKHSSEPWVEVHSCAPDSNSPGPLDDLV
jgi:hypothetical protein